MSDSALLRVLKRIEKDLLSQKDGAFRRQIADVAPHFFRVNAADVQEQIRQQLLRKQGGSRGSTTRLPKTLEKIIKEEVPKFTARLFEEFDPIKARKFYDISERRGTPDDFTVVIIVKEGLKGNKGSIFRAIKTAKQKTQGPLIDAINRGLSRIGRDQSVETSSFLDVGHEKGLALERVEQALDTIGEAIQDVKSSDQSGEFKRVVRDLRKLGVSLGISSRWPRENKEFTVSVFLESSALNRSKGAQSEREVIFSLQRQLRDAILRYKDWGIQKSSDSKVLQTEKEVIKSLRRQLPKGSVKSRFEKELIEPVDKKPSKLLGTKKKKPRIKPVAVKDSILEVKKTLKSSPSQNFLQLKPILDAKINAQVAENMGLPRLVFRTGRFAQSVRITDIKATARGFPSIGYTYQKFPYQIFEPGVGRPPWATPDRDPRRIIDASIRDIAKEFIIGRFFTRRM